MSMTTQEKTDYKRKFNEEKYDRIGLYIPSGDKGRWESAAKALGMSLNKYIIQAVEDKIKGRQ